MSLKATLISGALGLSLSFGALAAPKNKAPKAEPARAFSACVYQLSDPEKTCMQIDVKGVDLNKNADRELAPASLNKMMTAHLLMKYMAEHGKKMDDPFTYVSREDAQIGRTGERNDRAITDGRTLRYRTKGVNYLPGLPEDHVFTYGEFISAMLVFSANDFTAATARMLAPDGKQETFAQMMTDEARRIGMNDTTFKTASGMPATGQITTAQDMSRLVHHIVNKYGAETFSSLFGQKETIIAGHTVPGHLRLLNNGNILGGKTGLDAGGSNVAGYEQRGNYGVTFTTLGSPGARTRDSYTVVMLNKIFNALIPSAEARTEPVATKATAKKKKPIKKVKRTAPKKVAGGPKT